MIKTRFRGSQDADIDVPFCRKSSAGLMRKPDVAVQRLNRYDTIFLNASCIAMAGHPLRSVVWEYISRPRHASTFARSVDISPQTKWLMREDLDATAEIQENFGPSRPQETFNANLQKIEMAKGLTTTIILPASSRLGRSCLHGRGHY